MNWRRGLFRLWIVGSVLLVLAIAFISYSDIKAQFDTALKPNTTFEVQLPDGRTFEVQAPDMETATAMVRTLPEGFIIDKPPNPWATLGLWASIALGIPLAVLALGASLVVWAFSGFAAKRS
jgi:hypothetical protein